jgi:adenine-specific DNA-methyltransferase
MSYSTKEFLEKVDVSEATLRRWISEGDRIPELIHAKRDWRGWRIWEDNHVKAVMRYKSQKKKSLTEQNDNQQSHTAEK